MGSSFRVSICGGGIGGLTLALAIGKYGKASPLEVDVFEAGPTITTVGAGITFFARTLDIMKDLGLYNDVIKMAIKAPLENTSLNFRKSDQPDGYHWFTENVTNGQLTVHRKDFVDLLSRHIPDSCKVHTSKRLEYYDVDTDTGKFTLHFSDGSKVITDILVGADGIRSATRKAMYQSLASLAQGDDSRSRLLECIDPVWTGILIYRNLIPTEKISKEYPGIEEPTELTLHCGRNKHLVTFPVSQGRLINVLIYIHDSDAFGTAFEGHWVESVSEGEVLDQFEDWEAPARAIVKCIEGPSRWALHTTRPLPHYVNDRVVLLGDSAHAMEPHFGAGAGQAMEDALVLGRLLTHELTHEGNVADALKVYEEVRLPFANSIVQRSRQIGRYYALQRDLEDDYGTDRGSPNELDCLRRLIEDAWVWQMETARVWEEAEERWREKCGTRAYV